MNFFKRAIKNVTRKPTKSLLLLITFFVIGNFVIIGLGVSQASDDAKVLTRQKMRAVVTYGVDYDAINKYVSELTDEDEINEFYENYPRVTLADVHEILKDPRVKTANATSISQFYGVDDELTYVHLNNQAEENAGGGTSCWIDENGNEQCSTYIEPNFSAKGNYFPNMIEIVDGDYTIVEGRFYSQEEIDDHENVVLISKALAEENGLRVGDTLKVYTYSPSDVDQWLGQYGISIDDIILELEIIGLYDHNQKITPDSEQFDWTYPYENVDNMFLMPATTLSAANISIEQKMFEYWQNENPEDEYYNNPDNYPSLDNENYLYVNDVTILLNDPLEVDTFVKEHEGTIRSFMKLDANNDEFNRLARPLDTLSLYANFIVWLVVINAVVIITLVTALTLKTREYEIGVLLSMGTSKAKIIGQFFVELAIVAIIGFSLSIVSGSLIANKVGATVLDYQIESSGVKEDTEEDYWGTYPSIWNNDYTTDVSLEDLVAEYNVSVSPLIIGEIYVVGLGIVLISILIPSMMIMRFNPKRILMNQG